MDAHRIFAGQAILGGPLAELTGIVRDSRQVAPGSVFAVTGSASPEHLAEARTRGAGALLREGAPPVAAPAGTGPGAAPDSGASGAAPAWPVLWTSHGRWSFAHASARAHGLDRLPMPVVGVFGTAGKSTTTHCAWWSMGRAAARIGTIGWHDGTSETPNPQTTPPPEQLHAFLARLPEHCPGVAIEISSHAADQQRLAGIGLNALAFTGLGHDHLDYHRSRAAYLTAKLKILRWLRPGGLCVVNADDVQAPTVVHAVRARAGRIIALGFGAGGSRLRRTETGTYHLRHDGRDRVVPMPVPGDYNAWNAAAGALLATATGVPLELALSRLADLPAVPGRLERLAAAPATYVDYAHTPDEIAVMIRALRATHPGRRLVCVFGCGGDRDPSKRAPMGQAALAADLAILTTDNCRSESPQAIAAQVIAGLPDDAVQDLAAPLPPPGQGRGQIRIEHDRATAIRAARRLAGVDGVVVVAGKGHETDQLVGGAVLPWDDRAFVRSLEGLP
jgi:UDP-N-acetylmuramoyl-L-alanyl-D-glutamate--2,6-diaminopimelate ligase